MNTAEATIQNNQVTTKGKAKKAVLFSLGTLALGTLAFFGIKHFKKQKTQSNDNDNQTPSDLDTKIPVQANTNSVPRTSVRPAATGTAFPLNLRAKGNKVLELQQSLMRTYGSDIFPKHGADGDFGSELASFLRSKGYGVPLSEADFNKITQAQTQAATPLVAFDSASVAKGLHASIIARDFTSAMTLLKSIKDTSSYALVSEKLKQYYINGVRQTLVNAMLNTFNEASQKTKVQETFKGMGLKYDGNKWALSGLNGIKKVQLETTKTCTIYTNGSRLKIGMTVPHGVVIGTKISEKNGNTHFWLFDAKQHFYVSSDCVKTIDEDTSLSGTKEKIKEGDKVSSAKQTLAIGSQGNFTIVPNGIFLGKLNYIHNGVAHIETGLGMILTIKSDHIKKAK